MCAGLAAAPVVASAFVAAFILGAGAAGAACPPGAKGRCVNLDLVPQISREIVATERLAVRPKEAPVAERQSGYTGPTLGTAKNLRRAPEVGYRWSIN